MFKSLRILTHKYNYQESLTNQLRFKVIKSKRDSKKSKKDSNIKIKKIYSELYRQYKELNIISLRKRSLIKMIYSSREEIERKIDWRDSRSMGVYSKEPKDNNQNDYNGLMKQYFYNKL